jgi:Uma2 family endonuclease
MPPEDTHVRILNGNPCPPSIPGIKHRSVALKVAAALLRYVETRKLGRVLQAPCNVVLSGKIVIQPDILFVKKERRSLIGEMNLRGAPDLVIEILSRATREHEFKAKRRIYAHFEIPECWAVDSDASTVETMVWSEMGYVSVGQYRKSDRLSSPLLRGLNLPLSKIFETEDELE